MKKKLALGIALMIAVALFATACGSDDDVDVNSQADPDETETPVDNADGEDENAAAVTRIWVGPQLEDCVGVAPQECMLVRFTEDGQPEFFYDGIEGFTHEVGTSYVLDVEITEVENPPADASSLRYRLVEIVEAATEQASDQLDGGAWTLLGFRDGDLFDPVADGVEITIAFEGDRVNGSAGCNNYMGTFAADASSLSFGPLAATKKLCEPAVMAFEDRYLPILESVETAELTFDDRLILAPSAGLTLIFAPA